MRDTLVKICGLSTPETVDAALDAGATHLGFVQFERSPRHVSLPLAAQLRARVPAHAKSVLLVVNMAPQELAQAVAVVRPDIVQFHGKETPEFIAQFKAHGDHAAYEIWKAIGVKEQADLEAATVFNGVADRLLFDAPARALPGGNGLVMDWSLLANYRAPMPWALAGGLNPDNIAQAIAQTGAPLVDTSSGVESAPGVKDVDRIMAFCQAAKRS